MTSGDEQILTPKGTLQVKHVLSSAKDLGAIINSIISSPVTRAKETAEIAKVIFGIDYAIANALEPESSPDAV